MCANSLPEIDQCALTDWNADTLKLAAPHDAYMDIVVLKFLQ